MTDLRRYAKGQPCQIRVPQICDGGGETTVAAHYRLSGVSGMGFKSPDAISAHACAPCHAYVDSHHDAETKVLLLEGIVRTQAKLIKAGIIRWQ